MGIAAMMLLCSGSVYPQRRPSPSIATDPIAPPDGRKDQGSLKFQARAELVLLPVIVTRAGKHVSGLTKGDFTVYEDHKARKIAVFEEQKANAQPVHTESPRPSEFSNAVENRTSSPSSIIIALDLVNTPVLEQTHARYELIGSLSHGLPATQVTTLLAITRQGMRVLHSFTTNPHDLVTALEGLSTDQPITDSYPAYFPPVHDPAVARPPGVPGVALDADRLTAFSPGDLSKDKQPPAMLEKHQQRQAIDMTLDSLRQIASAFAGVAGRKSLIWVGAGFPFSGDPSGRFDLPLTQGEHMAKYERTWNLLSAANIAVYPSDVRGVVNPAYVGADIDPDTIAQALKAEGPNPIVVKQARQLADRTATLTAFAEATGGEPCYGTQVKNCLQQALRDGESYYLLGYYLDRKNTEAGWRNLSVKVRAPGVEVRTRKGFYVTDNTLDPEAGRKTDIALALTSPLNYTGLPVSGRWTSTTDGPGGKKQVGFELRVAGDSIFIDAGDHNRMVVEFVGMATTAKGERAGEFTQTVEGRMKAESIRKIRAEGLSYTNFFEIAPGEYRVHVVVRDNLTGKTGSVSIPLKVAP